jgi:glucose/arabinose dehydrogenase
MEVVNMGTSDRHRVRSSVVACIFALAAASRVEAFSGGITTQSFGAGGCNQCHVGGIMPTVTLSGPTVVAPNSTNEYTLQITESGLQNRAGLNVSALLGTLATGGSDSANTQAVVGTGGRDEVTHTSAKMASLGVVTFSFLWTAPSSFSSASLEAWGNAVNGNFSTSGDKADHDSLTIVSNLVTPTPTSAVETPTPQPTAPGLANPIRQKIRKGSVNVKLETVASGLTAPVWATAAPGVDPKFLFAVDQSGIFWRIDVTTGVKSVFLDVTSRMIPLGVFGPGTYDERGFLGAAFDPSYATNGLLYTFTSEPATPNPDFSTMPPATAPDCQSAVVEWHVPNPTDPGAVVDSGSARLLLRIDKPQFNHNGGGLSFGPDGMLYLSTGDGGGADDQDGQPFIGGPTVGHGANGNGQNTGVALGKLLRIDPHGTNAANGQYGIPADNPLVGAPGAVEEIWAYGFRNPFRFSFDSLTQALYTGDVGQNSIEEVDVVTRGGNYGWRLKEGTFFFDFNGAGAGFVTKKGPAVPPGLLEPVAQYDHDEGLAVIGGFVYRGTQIPKLVGRYVFGEFARTFSNDGRLFYLRKKDLVRPGFPPRRSRIAEFRLVAQDVLGQSLLGLGQDANGELYVLTNGTAAPFGTTGAVQRIAPP